MSDETLVFNSDNGLIALALEVYVHQAYSLGGDQKLIDRANELAFIFKNKSISEVYDWKDSGFGEQGI